MMTVMRRPEGEATRALLHLGLRLCPGLSHLWREEVIAPYGANSALTFHIHPTVY